MTVIRFGENTADDYNSATEDSRMAALAPTTNYGSDIDLRVGKVIGGNHRSIIRFFINTVLSGLGANSVALGELNLYCKSERSSDPGNISLFRVLLNWVENQVTWNIYSTGNDWNTPPVDEASDITGEDSTADRRATAEAGAVITGTGSYFSFNITAAVEAWRAGNWSEYGLAIINDDEVTESIEKRFSSSDDSDTQRPYLEVTYVPPLVMVGSRIADSSRSWQGAENEDIEDWAKENDAILVIMVER